MNIKQITLTTLVLIASFACTQASQGPRKQKENRLIIPQQKPWLQSAADEKIYAQQHAQQLTRSHLTKSAQKEFVAKQQKREQDRVKALIISARKQQQPVQPKPHATRSKSVAPQTLQEVVLKADPVPTKPHETRSPQNNPGRSYLQPDNYWLFYSDAFSQFPTDGASLFHKQPEDFLNALPNTQKYTTLRPLRLQNLEQS